KYERRWMLKSGCPNHCETVEPSGVITRCFIGARQSYARPNATHPQGDWPGFESRREHEPARMRRSRTGTEHPMLEQMRRSGASIFIYLIFGLLIAIFVININPGNRGGNEGGCGGSHGALITVDTGGINQNDFNVAANTHFASQLAEAFG